LAIYLRTVVDFALPMGIYFALFVLTAGAVEVVWPIGAIIVGLYGYFRVQFANDGDPDQG
jgi:hypothetical protein